MVGLVRFELTTSCTPCKRATRLRYSPNKNRRVRKRHAVRRGKSFFGSDLRWPQKGAELSVRPPTNSRAPIGALFVSFAAHSSVHFAAITVLVRTPGLQRVHKITAQSARRAAGLRKTCGLPFTFFPPAFPLMDKIRLGIIGFGGMG